MSISLQRGFTLLEMMAVVMLIGILATTSVVLFSPGGAKKDFHNELERFIEYSNQVSDFSVLTGEPVGLVATPPAWAENPLETPGWVYSWKRFVAHPPASIANFASSFDPTNTDAEQVSPEEFFQQYLELNSSNAGEWMDIEGVDPVLLGADTLLYIKLQGEEWDWEATPKHQQPIFILFPTGEAEPLMFEIEFVHANLEIEPQNVALDETGKLQWLEVRDAMQALKERF